MMQIDLPVKPRLPGCGRFQMYPTPNAWHYDEHPSVPSPHMCPSLNGRWADMGMKVARLGCRTKLELYHGCLYY